MRPDAGPNPATEPPAPEPPTTEPPAPERPDFRAALARGPEAAVEAAWQLKMLNWGERHRERGGDPASPLAGLLRLLRAAHAEPRLRRLMPGTSHFSLWFSLSTTYPSVAAGPTITEPLRGGGYLVRFRTDEDPVPAATAEEAVALIVASLPADLGEVFNHPVEQGR
ncbi:DUF6193 family natural product biosynthesis protein [Streptomyces sp. Y1]|uniref:DUF6193 family natural product biosynthesis protein n=1 Tax=Streptomyces sp. Y1 TaxID=3238634 RepID=A0AB39TSB2_9ACTN